MGRAAGFDWSENTMMPAHTRGGSNGAYLINGASQTGATLVVDTGATAPSQGDVITIAGVYSVHPETKVSTGVLQQFVIGSGATTTSFPISPAIVTSGATQNVSGSPADNAAITFAGTASTAVQTSLLFQKEAFAFATADLVMPQGVDFAAREVMDGLSMRIVRAYDINNNESSLAASMFCTATRLSARSSPAATTTTNPQAAEPLRGFSLALPGSVKRHRMSISTYSELKTRLSTGASARTCLRFSATSSLSQSARIQRSLLARVQEVETEITMTVGSRYVALPSDFDAPYCCLVKRQAYRAKNYPNVSRNNCLAPTSTATRGMGY